MYSQHGAAVAPPQKPETFMLSSEAQQSLPQDAQVALQQVDNLKYFLISAPVDWTPDQAIRRFLLPTGDYISCVLWNNLFHISGTDIVRCLSFRFQAFGRPVKNSKKFEEGIFSDLRNLKSGTDASLEEPKSPFLDLLYKNNCIRTQKKQKVFYWYSVPHDRLFLDALERDLKREKMGQEATTIAVNEPALSFEFDSSQSLFEQLTKAQQANSSSFSTHANTSFAQNTSPAMRPIDPMGPPQHQHQHQQQHHHQQQQQQHQMAPPPSMPMVPEESQNPGMYTQMNSMSSAQMSGGMVKREQDYGQFQYDRNGNPMPRMHQRHTSMPSYMEYSPAPSFVSSHYEDYSNRGISFEPITPPQQSIHLGAEPAYIANEDTGLYTAIPDVGSTTAFNPMMQLPPSNISGPQFSTVSRSFPSANVYSVIEGSPTYKQRRRRSSIPPSVTNAIAAAAAANAQSPGSHIQNHTRPAHRPSDLRRSVSSSVAPPVLEGDELNQDSPPGLTNSYTSTVAHQKDLLNEISRSGTPLSSLEESPQQQQQQNPMSLINAHDELAALTNGETLETSVQSSPAARVEQHRPGPARRARSATMMEIGPYPQKSHSCPIPSCGRLFKRLEHLKRHVRTHTRERPYPCPYCSKAFSRSDNLAQHRRIHETQADGQPHQETSLTDEDLENEENEFGSIEEGSPSEEQNFLPNGLVSMDSITSIPASMPSSMSTHQSMPPPMVNPQMVNPEMIAPQMLQQPM